MPQGLTKKILLGAVFVAFLALHIFLKLQNPPAADTGRGAGFDAVSLDGRKINLAAVAQSHQLTIINFWESWCGPCKMELPELQKLYTDNRGDIEMIGVYQTSSDESIQELVRQHGLTYPMVRDDGRISKPYSVQAVPTTLVLDPQMKIVRSMEGVDFELATFVKNTLQKQKKKT